jgi:hypothetical protein
VDIRFQRATAPADADLAAYARRCLLLRLQHRSNDVVRVDVELVDAASQVPRRDSYCIVRMQLQGLPAATVVDVSANVRMAIDRAADRAGLLTEAQWRQANRSPVPQTLAVAP